MTRRRPAGVAPPPGSVERAYLDGLERWMHELWALGRNVVLVWAPLEKGLEILLIPHYVLADFASDKNGGAASREFIEGVLSRPKLVSPEELHKIADRLDYKPKLIDLPFTPGKEAGLDVMDDLIKRYGISYVEDRAVALFDIVGFSLYPPLEQVTQLNSLSYSVNSAFSKMLNKQFDLSFARTTTGDGFYIWNRGRGVQANINLYHFMHLVLADNAISHGKSKSGTTPLLRTAFHVGGHYEFYQPEGLSPTIYSYIVGDVTIELARMIDKAIPGQIIVGDFKMPMSDGKAEKIQRIGPVEFIERTQATLSSLKGLELSGDGIESIKCYLTGAEGDGGAFGVSRYRILDKHGRGRNVFNAKVNIYRKGAEAIFLGAQARDLNEFDAAEEYIIARPDPDLPALPS
ncbi:MAG TPA: hypothetical protein ENI55_04115 [Alphaproteobacteria bacterium]|nr:hypothetical protein [Alphaproteobacteria bacterium]